MNLKKRITTVRRVSHQLRQVGAISGVVGLCLLVPLVIWQFTRPDVTEAAWFDGNYLTRQRVDVTGISASQTDYQVKITLNTSSLISAGIMQSDCDDIRVTDQTGKSLPYWVETGAYGCNTSATNVWVKVPSVPTTGTTLYLYYNNSSATSNQRPKEIFPFFDDFSGSNLDGKMWSSTGAYSISGGEVTVTTGALTTNTPILTDAQNHMFEANVKYGSTAGEYSGMHISNATTIDGNNAGSNKLIMLMTDVNTLVVTAWAASGISAGYNLVSAVPQFTATANTYTVIGYSMNTANIRYYNNRTVTNSYSGTWTGQPYLFLGYFFGANSWTTNIRDMTVDWVFARKFVTTEPTVTLASAETTPAATYLLRLDEGQGQIAQESSSNNLDGTLGAGIGASTDDPTWQTEANCVKGKCLSFDGGDQIIGSDHNILSPSYNDMTISFWAKVPVNASASGSGTCGAAGRYMVSKGNTGAWEWAVENDNNSLLCFITWQSTGNDHASIGVSRTVNDGLWHHYTFVIDDTVAITAYIDGKLAGSNSTFTGTSVNGSATIYWGARSDGNQFIGSLDEISIFPYVRSTAQILSEFNQGGAVVGLANQNKISQGLVGYWKLDESSWTNNCSTTSVTDSSGYGGNAAACPNSTGPTGGVPGKYGNAGTFDGTNDYLSLASGAGTTLDLANADLSLGAWFYPTQVSSTVAIAGKQNGSVFGYGLMQNGSGIGLALKAADSTTFNCDSASSLLSTNTWYHVTATLDDSPTGTTVNLYLNGQLVKNCQSSYRVGSTGNAFLIGARNGGASGLFTGKIDEVRVYNRTLSSNEVLQLANEDRGPIAHYTFDDGTGTSALDNSGNAQTGTLNGGMSSSNWVTGKLGRALNFDGVNDYVLVSNTSALSLSDNFTLEAWIKPNNVATSWQAIINKGTTSNWDNRAYSLFLDLDEVAISYKNGNGWQEFRTTAANVVAGQWTHVVYTRDGTTEKIFVNGKLENSGTVTQFAVNDSFDLVIGGMAAVGDSVEKFGGVVDDVKIYNYSRNAQQVMQDMQADAPTPVAGIKVPDALAYFSLDEQQGQTTNNSGALSSGVSGTLGASSSVSTDDPTWKTKTNCKVNGCLSFDGGDQVTLGTPSTLDLDGQVALSAWFNISTQKNSRIISIGGSSSSPFIEYMLGTTAAGKGRFEVQTAGSTTSLLTAETLSTGVWYHLVGVWDGNTMQVYLNGKLSNSSVKTGSVTEVNNTAYIGGDNTAYASEGFNGLIDEVKVYGSGLSATQASQDYNVGGVLNFSSAASSEASLLSDGEGNPPVAYWSLDERQDNTCVGGTNDVCDRSGNSYNGAFSGTPTWTTGKFGQAVQFPGSSYADFGDTGGLESLSAISYGAWVYPTSYGPGTAAGDVRSIISKAALNGAGTSSFAMYFQGNGAGGNNLTCAVDTTSGLVTVIASAQSNVPLSSWSHVMCTWSTGNTVKLYANGKYLGQSSVIGGTTRNIATTLRIGSSGYLSEDTFVGKIDEVKIYDSARTQSQVAYDFNRGAPISYLQFDECQGSTVYDASGNANHATLSVGASGTTALGTCNTSSSAWGNGINGKFNTSVYLDGVDDKVDLANDLTDTHSVGSVCTWFYYDKATDDGTQGTLFSVSDNASVNYKYSFYISDTGSDSAMIRAVMRTNTSSNQTDYASANNAVSRQTWNHMCFVQDGTGVKTYLNTSLVSTTVNVQGTGALSDWFDDIATNAETVTVGYIGDNSADSFFTGKLDDFRLYNYPLSLNQIKQLFNQGAGVRFAPSSGTP